MRVVDRSFLLAFIILLLLQLMKNGKNALVTAQEDGTADSQCIALFESASAAASESGHHY